MSSSMSWEGVPVTYISRNLLDLTVQQLASFAASEPAEGVTYWFGIEGGGRAVVTTLVVPNATSTPFGVQTSAAANAEALGSVAGTPLVLLGQAHSHPRGWVQHSLVDDRDTFAQYRGAISLVVPWLGRRGLDLTSCGLYRHDGVRYREIQQRDFGRHLVELPGSMDLRTAAPSFGGALAP